MREDDSLPFTAFLRYDEETRPSVGAFVSVSPLRAIPRNTVLWPCSPLSRNFFAGVLLSLLFPLENG